ncbi:MAG TPA: nickel-type superoxide dismutase maturation protease [Acidimicrobiales bacterium]|jgi:nickel-type superoxide dismutase maturation protease|nr:nickel-type superoxide dismutase maturation protease [Acidimicrobiales bacterium]
MVSRPLAGLAAGAVAGAALCRSLRRVEVAGSSMSPALLAGDKVLVLALPRPLSRWPRPGEVIAVRDPRDPSRVLIKRVASVDRRSGTLEVAGDAQDASTDSRQFGPVPRSSVVGRAVYRYAPAGRSGPGPWPEEYHRA